MGLLSDGGVHSHINHLFELLHMVADKVNNVYIHCFMDGRDTYADSGVKYMEKLLNKCNEFNNVKIASIMGRYYAMDREQNWERTEKAYKTLTLANAEYYSNDPISAINASYELGKMDEFIEPIVITDNEQTYTIKDNDGVIFFNFRDDRARQITASFVEDKFDKFARNNLKNIYFCGFSQYDDKFENLHSAFQEDNLSINLSQTISANGLKQFKIAETTKYAHVTFYLNGGIEKPYDGEERFLIETIKDKPFDETPEMRTREITDKAVEEIKTGKYSFMTLNYSNCDMLGHTGNLEATIESVKIMDIELKKLIDAIISIDGVAIITADHGNAEIMIDKDGKKLTEHTTSKVPFIVVNAGDINLKQGKLANIAPTIIELLGLNKPEEFTAESLIDE
jgi:2,3-bisphosphoglycerate-independent phosphoglycerate mutase